MAGLACSVHRRAAARRLRRGHGLVHLAVQLPGRTARRCADHWSGARAFEDRQTRLRDYDNYATEQTLTRLLKTTRADRQAHPEHSLQEHPLAILEIRRILRDALR